jgi:hypothetical protein
LPQSELCPVGQLLRTGDYTQNPGQPPETRGFECNGDITTPIGSKLLTAVASGNLDMLRPLLLPCLHSR